MQELPEVGKSTSIPYRSGAYHGLLLRHCQRQGMFDVPPRHQPRGTIIKVSAQTRADIFFAFFICICQKKAVPLQLKNWENFGFLPH